MKYYLKIFFILVALLCSSVEALMRDYCITLDCEDEEEYLYCLEHSLCYHKIDYSLLTLIPAIGEDCSDCRKPSIFSGYLDEVYNRYVSHLTRHLEYCQKYPCCTCFWPELSKAAGQISDIAYLLFNDLICTTALSDVIENEEA